MMRVREWTFSYTYEASLKPLPFKFTFIILIKSVLSLSMIIPMIVENISISVWDLACLYSLQLHSILLLPRMVIVLCSKVIYFSAV